MNSVAAQYNSPIIDIMQTSREVRPGVEQFDAGTHSAPKAFGRSGILTASTRLTCPTVSAVAPSLTDSCHPTSCTFARYST